MDIKSKKWKVIISFTAFALGISLLLQGLTGLLCSFAGSGNYFRDSMQELAEGDYQSTSNFKWHMSGTMNALICMGMGGNLDHLYGGYGWYGDYGWNAFEEGTAEAAVEAVVEDRGNSATAVESTASSFGTKEYEYDYGYDYGYDYNYDYDYSYSGEKLSNEEMAEQLHERMKNDKNVLYSVSKGGKEIYTNAGDFNWQDHKKASEEGYNFLMYFEGEKVSLLKEGNPLNIYGDGIYRDENDWRLPGYRNFVSDEESSDVLVSIAVAEDPVNYIGSNSQRESRLYWIKQNLILDRERMIRILICLGTAVLFFSLYFVLRREKKEADKAIAHIMGRIWVELKAVWIIWMIFFIVGVSGVVRDYYYMELAEEYFSVWQLYQVIRQIFSEAANVMLLFWTLYLAAIDFKYNPGTWKNGLCTKLTALLGEKESKLPIAIKTLRRYKLVILTQVGVLAVYILFGFILFSGGLNSGKVLLLLLPPIALFLLQLFYLKPNAEVLRDIDIISEQIISIRSGNLTEGMGRPRDTGLFKTAENLTDIQKGMKEAMEEQMKSERMKVELIANVSHDIKTPLTSIISYVELLRQEENLPEQVRDYITILENKSQRLKTMIQDVFEVSRASSGQLPVSLEELDLGKLLRQTLADMGEQIDSSSVTIKSDIPEFPVMIMADGEKLYRVFQNLLINSLKYSLEGSRVYITVNLDGCMAAASVKNTSYSEISGQLDFTERFLRGDESRSDGGSGLGLSIAKSFTEACGGSFKVETIADLFIVTVEFAVIEKSDVSE